jgi:hypothetical protein
MDRGRRLLAEKCTQLRVPVLPFRRLRRRRVRVLARVHRVVRRVFGLKKRKVFEFVMFLLLTIADNLLFGSISGTIPGPEM